MSPHEEIRNLLGRYCEAMDAGEFDVLGELFAHGVLRGDDGTEVAAGAAGVQRLYTGGTRLHGGSPRTRHVTANPIIEVDETAGTATARSSFVVFQATDHLALAPIIAGRYRDRFEQIDGTWWFTERTFAVDQVGDLSQHLTYEVGS